MSQLISRATRTTMDLLRHIWMWKVFLLCACHLQTEMVWVLILANLWPNSSRINGMQPQTIASIQAISKEVACWRCQILSSMTQSLKVITQVMPLVDFFKTLSCTPNFQLTVTCHKSFWLVLLILNFYYLVPCRLILPKSAFLWIIEVLLRMLAAVIKGCTIFFTGDSHWLGFCSSPVAVTS